MTSGKAPVWIAADWGTSNLRIWALGADGNELDHHVSAKGMGTLQPTEFEPALLDLIGDLLPMGRKTPVIICGMAGSRQGWAEAPYRTVPCPPPGLTDATRVSADDPRLDVFLLPGLKQQEPADVMRGEETQIAGALALHPDFEGVLCLPGTHTKWARIANGSVKQFQTFMTGEMFALLSKQSVLRHSLPEDVMDTAAFNAAVSEMKQNGGRNAADLFGIRAGSLISDLDPAGARGRLSGLLIGAELAAVHDLDKAKHIAVLGSVGIANLYDSALGIFGKEAVKIDADTATLRGLCLAYDSLKDITR